MKLFITHSLIKQIKQELVHNATSPQNTTSISTAQSTQNDFQKLLTKCQNDYEFSKTTLELLKKQFSEIKSSNPQLIQLYHNRLKTYEKICTAFQNMIDAIQKENMDKYREANNEHTSIHNEINKISIEISKLEVPEKLTKAKNELKILQENQNSNQKLINAKQEQIKILTDIQTLLNANNERQIEITETYQECTQQLKAVEEEISELEKNNKTSQTSFTQKKFENLQQKIVFFNKDSAPPLGTDNIVEFVEKQEKEEAQSQDTTLETNTTHKEISELEKNNKTSQTQTTPTSRITTPAHQTTKMAQQPSRPTKFLAQAKALGQKIQQEAREIEQRLEEKTEELQKEAKDLGQKAQDELKKARKKLERGFKKLNKKIEEIIDDPETAAKKAEEKLERGVEKLNQKVEEIIDDPETAFKKAGKKLERGAEKMEEKFNQAANRLKRWINNK